MEPNPEQILGGIMLELIGLLKMTHNYFHAALRSAVALVLLEMSFVSDTTQFRGADLGRVCSFIWSSSNFGTLDLTWMQKLQS